MWRIAGRAGVTLSVGETDVTWHLQTPRIISNKHQPLPSSSREPAQTTNGMESPRAARSVVKNTTWMILWELLALCKVCIRVRLLNFRLAQFLLWWCYDVWLSVYDQSNHILTQLGPLRSNQGDHISHSAHFRLHSFTSHYFISDFWSRANKNPRLSTLRTDDQNFPPESVSWRVRSRRAVKKVSAKVWTKRFVGWLNCQQPSILPSTLTPQLSIWSVRSDWPSPDSNVWKPPAENSVY